MDGRTVWEELQQAWIVVAESGGSLALISPFHAEGVVAPLYSTRERAEAGGARAARGGFSAHPVPSLWQVISILAEQGFAGLLLDEEVPLFFVTEQPEAARPTHLAIPQGNDFLIVGAAGPTALSRTEVQPWSDLAAFDRLSIRWLLGSRLPFLDYSPTEPLVEYLPDGDPQLVPETGMLLAADGAVREALALFSSSNAAEWYWESLTDARFTGEGKYPQQLAVHRDVVARLEAYAPLLPPHAAIILNPGRHRFYQGFFRRMEQRWYLVTINGVWRVEPPFRCTQLATRT